MVDFGGLADKAKSFLRGHDDQVKDGIKKVGDFVGDKIGHDKVDGVESKLGGMVDKLAGNHGDTPAATTGGQAPVTPTAPTETPAAPTEAPAAPAAPATPTDTPAAPKAPTPASEPPATPPTQQ